MTDINPEARARREAARDNGRFGAQEHTDPEVTLHEPGSIDERITQTLERKAAASREQVTMETRGLQPGAVVLTETNTPHSPFGFALSRSRELRRRWYAAGMPQTLTVTGRRRAPEDGHTDDEVTFDLNGEPLVLTFHRDATFRTLQ